jgi:predicted permease
MQTRQQFCARLEAASREENRVGLLWLGAFFIGILAQIPLLVYVVQPSGSVWLAIAQVVETFVLVFGNVWLMMWYFKNRARRFGLICPGCGGALHGYAGKVVAQWGNCPACKTAVWVD